MSLLTCRLRYPMARSLPCILSESSLINTLTTLPPPPMRVDFEKIDIDHLIKRSDLEFKWTINIPTVAQMIPGINEDSLS